MGNRDCVAAVKSALITASNFSPRHGGRRGIHRRRSSARSPDSGRGSVRVIHRRRGVSVDIRCDKARNYDRGFPKAQK